MNAAADDAEDENKASEADAEANPYQHLSQSPSIDWDVLVHEPPACLTSPKKRQVSVAREESDASDADPLDVMDQAVDDPQDAGMSASVHRMYIDSEQVRSDPPPGQPITSASWSILNRKLPDLREKGLDYTSSSPKKVIRPDSKIWQSDE